MSKSERLADDRFRAFVSYSHADASVARKLHRKLETYRLPPGLRDALDGDGAPDGRVGKIFRDREDFSAAQDLSQAVQEALAASQALIIICSPDAKASLWVAQEITLFRKLHPDRPILAALIRGEPAEAFPAPLLQDGAEPLAADLRKEGDGWRLGFLKIVAGIAGAPLDALVQRDASRRLRRVMAVTGSALIALLAMIGMTIFALQSRNEAQHQQAEAEGLVEYMLTDLRTELKGASTLRVMTKVNERAMDYYEGQGDLSDMPAESLERRARILHAMGEDDEKRGDLDKALKKFTEAHRVTEALLARDPENPDRIFGHAQSEYWVGYIAYLKKDKAEALFRFELYRILASTLAKNDKVNSKWLREAAYAEGNLCSLKLEAKKTLRPAIYHCEQALFLMRQVSQLDNTPQSEIDMVNRISWLVDGYIAQQKFVKARPLVDEITIRSETLYATEPSNLDFLEMLIRAKLSAAKLNRAMGKIEIAERLRVENTILIDSLKKFDKQNRIWRSLEREISVVN